MPLARLPSPPSITLAAREFWLSVYLASGLAVVQTWLHACCLLLVSSVWSRVHWLPCSYLWLLTGRLACVHRGLGLPALPPPSITLAAGKLWLAVYLACGLAVVRTWWRACCLLFASSVWSCVHWLPCYWLRLLTGRLECVPCALDAPALPPW